MVGKIIVLEIGKLIFFMRRSEFEVAHVHVEFGRSRCKVYLQTLKVSAKRNVSKEDVTKIVKIVEKNLELFQRTWNEKVHEQKKGKS